MAGKIRVEGEAAPKASDRSVIQIHRESRDLATSDLRKMAGGLSYSDAIYKVDQIKQTPSKQGVALGRKPHPFNFEMVARFQTVNVHHSRSIHAKVGATVGMGFQTPNDRKRADAKAHKTPLGVLPPADDVAVIDTKLNPLCEHSWQDTINDVCEDLWQTGNGYLEVVRADGDEIVGIHHLPAKETFVVIEDSKYMRHFSIQGTEDSSGVRTFARFGDLDDFLARFEGGSRVTFDFSGPVDEGSVSEVIHFRRPTSLSRWYGFPDWLAAVAAIELVQCLTQHEYDFFLNRGVPEFMLFILGQKLHPDDKTAIESAMRSNIGLGNSHKSMLVNLSAGGDNLKVQLEKLAMESKSDGSQFAGMAESLGLQIVTAHGVPPLLAGIQVPGKLGAANEMVQSMQAFQTLVISPVQRLVRQTLMNTLGKEPSLGLTAQDMVLNTITDAIDVQTADTVARMRQTPQEAAAQGRDLGAGMRKEETWAEAIDAIMERACARSDR